jgi:PhnB protein
MSQKIPEGFTSVTPYVTFKDCRKAIDFYKNAFAAQERFVMPGPDGTGVMHAELVVGNSILMMGDEHPDMGGRSADSLGGSPVSFYLYVEDVDQAFRRALEAGATQQMEVQDMFWGDRTGTVQDPFGFSWTLATHLKDLTPEEMAQGAREAFAKMANI